MAAAKHQTTVKSFINAGQAGNMPLSPVNHALNVESELGKTGYVYAPRSERVVSNHKGNTKQSSISEINYIHDMYLSFLPYNFHI
jgi:hypothetical protein